VGRLTILLILFQVLFRLAILLPLCSVSLSLSLFDWVSLSALYPPIRVVILNSTSFAVPQTCYAPALARHPSRLPDPNRRSIHVSRSRSLPLSLFDIHVHAPMASSTTSLSSIAVTVSHAIAYITRPLVAFIPAPTILKLQLALEANLTAHYAHSWVPSEPSRGSGRRCLSFSPRSVPPRPIYAACTAAKVQWSQWMTALGNVEFDLIVDPGLVSVRFIQPGSTSKLITVWSDDDVVQPRAKSASTLANSSQPQLQTRPMPKLVPTLAQQLQKEDEEDEEELFAALAHELRAPTWTTPVKNQFPSSIPQKSQKSLSVSPASAGSHHSRSSSLSSDSFSWLSFDSADDSDASSVTTISSAGTEASKVSRRERAEESCVFIDSSKKEVTNYDGGKTTVLTGGVMLGRPAASKPAASQSACAARGITTSSGNWRSTRI